MKSEPLTDPLLSFLSQVLDEAIADADGQQILQSVEYLTPKVGKFWLGTEAKAGLYLVLAGKVRLLDAQEELLITLEAGEAFGEFTLFPETPFTPYDGRASVGLQLAFVPQSAIAKLWQKYPQLREQLGQRAQKRQNLLGEFPAPLPEPTIPIEAIETISSLK